MIKRPHHIRGKLTLQFIWIVASILLLFCVVIYYAAEKNRQSYFYSRLQNRSKSYAKLLLEVNEVDYNTLKLIDKNTGLQKEAKKVRIYNDLNSEIYNSVDNDTSTVSPYLLDEIRRLGEIRYEENGVEFLGITYTNDMSAFVIVSSAYDERGRKQVADLKTILIVSYLLGLGISSLAGRFFANRALLPIKRIVKQVNTISASNINKRLKIENENDEIGRLAGTFNLMLGRLESALDLHKNFISSASHELRTPLTTIQGEIEVALFKDRSVEEYKSVLSSLLVEVKGLGRLTNGLLHMTKAGMDISKLNLEPIRVDELIWECEMITKRAHHDYRIALHFNDNLIHDDSQLIVNGSKALLQIAFLNLIDNACKYSANHSVEITLDAEKDQILLQFSDNGIGIAKDQLVHLFEPFYRADNTENVVGHGLGLPLTKRILETHNGSIRVESQVNVGTSVFISIPKHQIEE